jgi:hypothetical protein
MVVALRALFVTGIAGLALAASTLAQAEWFTLSDASDKPGEVVQVDPTTITANGFTRTIRIRLNRDTPRRSVNGITFRSFEGTVSIDCLSRAASYDSYTFYSRSQFQGTPVVDHRFGPDEARVPALVSLRPDFAERVIRAACRADSNESNAGKANAGG